MYSVVSIQSTIRKYLDFKYKQWCHRCKFSQYNMTQGEGHSHDFPILTQITKKERLPQWKRFLLLAEKQQEDLLQMVVFFFYVYAYYFCNDSLRTHLF